MALIVTRHIGQSIIIGDDIKVTFLSTKSGSGIRISIEAPREISVHREEIYNRILKEQNRTSKFDKL